MTPTIGRIVHYNVAATDRYLRGSESDKVLPAVIVRVHDSTCVNLRVEPDREGYTVWRERVMLGTGPGQWCWPVRVEELVTAPPDVASAPVAPDPSVLREIPGWQSPAVERVADLKR